MTHKTRTYIQWTLAVLVTLLFTASSIGKFTADAEALEAAAKFGLTKSTYILLGILELISAILFLIPRTGILGTLLLAAYMGGAISTHVEFAQPVAAPIIISAFVWIAAVLRFPELTNRILNKK